MSVRLRSDLQPLPLRLVLRQRGELIRQGAPGDGLWLIETGALRAAAITDTGRELVIEMLGPGDAAGEPTGVPSSVSVRALRPCRLAPIHPRAAADVLAARAQRAAALAAELAWMDVRTRVARRLDDLADRFGRPVEDGKLILLPLTQDEVAAITGTSRESANRALRSLVDAGTIRVAGRGRYVVRSPMRLRSVDGRPCSGNG